MERAKSSFVYCIHDKTTKRSKIGVAADPEARLRRLQTGCPTRLKLVDYFAGGRYVERAFLHNYHHRRVFMHHRVSEWMKDDDGVVMSNFLSLADSWTPSSIIGG